jgi:hypothetical protein
VARNQSTQRQRTAQDPLLIGSFNETSIRYLQGSLGPKSQVIIGGYGGGTYNHWFKVQLEAPAWLIIANGPPRPQYIQISAYDLNRNPIEGRGILMPTAYRQTKKVPSIHTLGTSWVRSQIRITSLIHGA